MRRLIHIGTAAAAAGWFVVSNTGKQGTAGPATNTTSSINTTGATLIVIGVESFGSLALPVITDSRGNVWIFIRTDAVSGGGRTSLYYCTAPLTSATHTFTTTQTASLGSSIQVVAAGGVTGAVLDKQSGATVSTGSSLTLATSVTPSVSGEIIFTVNQTPSANGTSQPTVNSGFAITDMSAEVGTTIKGGAFARLIQGAIAAINPTWSWTPAVPGEPKCMSLATFGTPTYATWNPAAKGTVISLTGGNLTETGSGLGTGEVRATIPVLSGTKRYWEIKVITTTNDMVIGVDTGTGNLNQYTGQNAQTWGMYGQGGIIHSLAFLGGTPTAPYSNGDVIGLALDLVTNTLQFYKNNVATGSIVTLTPSLTYYPAAGTGAGAMGTTARFDPASMTYAAPAGFTAGVF